MLTLDDKIQHAERAVQNARRIVALQRGRVASATALAVEGAELLLANAKDTRRRARPALGRAAG